MSLRTNGNVCPLCRIGLHDECEEDACECGHNYDCLGRIP